jgi:hypothetical protein
VTVGIVDWHLHSAPSLAPRRGDDREVWESVQAAGVTTMVLKAHEGSSAERAALLGPGVVGGVVLNSTVGGANPDAVRVCHLLGGRAVWMPTISSEAHLKANRSTALAAHAGIQFAAVPVTSDGRLLAPWFDVLDQIAAADMVLVAGHLRLDETVVLFTEARRRGIGRLLVNHPGLPFQDWRLEHAAMLRSLDARIEVGIAADIIAGEDGPRTEYFAEHYPNELLVFGSDLGHTIFPTVEEGYRSWIKTNALAIGEAELHRIMTENGRQLLD